VKSEGDFDFLYNLMQTTSLKELAKLFLKLGTIAFGGPAAHIAMMQKEVVEKKKWMTEEHFLDLIGATNLIPGPNSTEMAIQIGRERAGLKGLLVAGFCFIVPAVIITSVFAYLYKQYGQLPTTQVFIYGIKPAIISIIIAAVYPLAKKAFKSIELIIIGVLALAACFLGVNELIVLFGSGIILLLLSAIRSSNKLNSVIPLLLLKSSSYFNSTDLKLFLSFLKIGSILYGSGYVLFAFLDEELVANGLLSRQQLIDAIAVGQFTPGPVFSSVTFIGYQISGWSGAIVSTVGVFLPSFLFVWLLNPLVPKMRASKLFSAFLDAVNVASVVIIIYACYLMGKDSINDWRTVLIAIISIVVTFSFKKINSVFIVVGGSLLGYVLSLL
jgi:chromate transporter